MLSSDDKVLHSVHEICTSSKFALPLGTVCLLGLRRIIALWVSVVDCEKRLDSLLTGIDISWQPVEDLGVSVMPTLLSNLQSHFRVLTSILQGHLFYRSH